MRVKGGYSGKILRVNLTDGTFKEEEPSEDLIRKFVGGRGWGIKLLYDELEAKVDPLSPENKLIFLTGPLCGTRAQSFSRWIVVFKSPLTGIYGRSCAGGYFGAELKFAGLDALIVEGSSEKPVYIWIHDDEYEIRDASEIWGLGTYATEKRIREELGEPRARVACIGPAGERLVKFACIMSGERAAGRCGGGCVMGSKNLKAIAVRGTGRVKVAIPELFDEYVKGQISMYMESPLMAPGGFKDTGTRILPFTIALGMYPTKNFREGMLEGWERLGKEEYLKLKEGPEGCYGCIVQCGAHTRMRGGKYDGVVCEGPEYEEIWAFSGPINCNDIGFTIAASRECDDLGMDSISTGNVIGFAYELYERGIITTEDTGGLELKYGDPDPAMELIKKIAYREGIGDILAEGTREAARRLGRSSEKYAMHVKGLEIPGYDPRGAKAHGLSMLTSTIGASHCIGYSMQEIDSVPMPVPKPVDRLGLEGKGMLAKYNQDFTAVLETGIGCILPASFGALSPGYYNKLLYAVTGIKEFFDINYLWTVGERIYNLERIFNVREGVSRKDDNYPDRIKYEVLLSGPSAKQVFEQEDLLNQYYEARGWDIETGIPKKSKLLELGLDFAVEYGV